MVVRLIVGLGNPGQQYSRHRHNFGFMLLDALAASKGARWQARFGGLFATWVSEQHGKIFALKPQEMMNLSGASVQKYAHYYDFAPEEILVAHDELDLPLGKLRLKAGGGAAGHNGIRDIIRHLGANFYRLRLGIGHPGSKELVHRYVLSNFLESEQVMVEKIIQESCRHHHLLVASEFQQFQHSLKRIEKFS